MSGEWDYARPSADPRALRQYTTALDEIRRADHAIDRKNVDAFVQYLHEVLRHLFNAALNPRDGLHHLCTMFEVAGSILTRCDGTEYEVRYFVARSVRELFVWYALRSDDAPWIRLRLYTLVLNDRPGLTLSLLAQTPKFLSPRDARQLAECLHTIAVASADTPHKLRLTRAVLILAQSIPDGELLSRAIEVMTECESPDGVISDDRCVSFARACYEAGNIPAAQTWLGRIASEDALAAVDGLELLRDIQHVLGHHQEVERLSWRIFREYRALSTLASLLEVIGHEDRDRFLNKETMIILGEPFAYRSMDFLVDCGLLDAAEVYIFKHAEFITGDMVPPLERTAYAMRIAGRFVAASLLLRRLLDRVLEGTPAHGFRIAASYLRDLAFMARDVDTWDPLVPHEVYCRDLVERHGDKTAFWEEFEMLRNEPPFRYDGD